METNAGPNLVEWGGQWDLDPIRGIWKANENRELCMAESAKTCGELSADGDRFHHSHVTFSSAMELFTLQMKIRCHSIIPCDQQQLGAIWLAPDPPME